MRQHQRWPSGGSLVSSGAGRGWPSPGEVGRRRRTLLWFGLAVLGSGTRSRSCWFSASRTCTTRANRLIVSAGSGWSNVATVTVRKVRRGAVGVVVIDDAQKRGVSRAEALLDRVRIGALGDLLGQPVSLGLDSGDVGVGAGDVGASGLAAV